MGISLNPSTLLSGQGINVSSLVQQILNAQSGPLTAWQSQASTLATQAGLIAGFNNNLTNLATAVSALADPLGSLAQLTATSSDSNAVTATALSTAVAGTHVISVTNLASTSVAYTDPVPSGTALTAGSFTVQVGNNTAQTINVTSGETLQQVAAAISNSNVTANVVQDADGSSILSLVSSSIGPSGDITVTGASSVGLTFNQIAGKAASLNVDGVPITSDSNTITGVIPGVTLNLLAPTGDSSAQVTIGADTQDAIDAISNFVSTYNTLISDIDQQYTVNAATNTEGPLGGDISLRELQSNLLSDASYAITGNDGFVNLASLGISTNDDGTLTVDNTILTNALTTNPTAVLNFFQNTSSTGFANNFNADLKNLTDPVNGILNVDLNQIDAEQQNLTDDMNNFQANLTLEQQQLTSEYDNVDAQLQSYPLLLQEVTEVLGTMGTSSSSTGTTESSSPTLTSGL